MLINEGTPTFEPISDLDVKASLRIDGNADDALISNLIDACTAQIETENNLRLAERTVTFAFRCLPDVLKLNAFPVSSITSITYLDNNRQRQTLNASTYQLVQNTGFPSVNRIANAVYPSVFEDDGSVVVTCKVGYADAASIPPALTRAVIVMVCDHFRNPDRPLQAQPNVQALLNPYRKGEWL